MEIVISKNEVPVRLTEERWEHITKNHDYMASYYFELLETIADPDLIVEGNYKELIAVKKLGKAHKYLVVIYKEVSKNDGFVITSFLTKRLNQIKRRKMLWQKP